MLVIGIFILGLLLKYLCYKYNNIKIFYPVYKENIIVYIIYNKRLFDFEIHEWGAEGDIASEGDGV